MRRSAIYILTVLLFASGCNKAVMEPQRMGSISLALSSNVEVQADTKADTQDCSDFLVSITGDTFLGSTWTQDYIYRDMPESVSIPYGTYVLKAENCSEILAETGFGCVRYYGASEPVEVISKAPATVSITCKMVNGKATLYIDESFLEDFADVTAELYCGRRKISFTAADAEDVYFNVAPDGSDLIYTIYGTVAAGTASERRVAYSNINSPMKLKPAKWAKITLKSNHNGILGPEIQVDDTMGENSLPELIDPNGGNQSSGNAGMELPTITVDVDIEEATVIDCYLDIQ